MLLQTNDVSLTGLSTDSLHISDPFYISQKESFLAFTSIQFI